METNANAQEERLQEFWVAHKAFERRIPHCFRNALDEMISAVLLRRGLDPREKDLYG